jgi:hypothetical protein
MSRAMVSAMGSEPWLDQRRPQAARLPAARWPGAGAAGALLRLPVPPGG